MELIHIKADWDTTAKRMIVELAFGGKRHIEKFTRHEWKKFIHSLQRGGDLRLGGLKLGMAGRASIAWSTASGIRDYLFKIDEAFRKAGSTELLKSEPPKPPVQKQI